MLEIKTVLLSQWFSLPQHHKLAIVEQDRYNTQKFQQLQLEM